MKRTLAETRPADLSYGAVAGVSALDILARSLADPGEDAWMENPCYGGARAAFRAAGLSSNSLPVGAAGMILDEAIARPAPRLIYVTPSHQYPLGSVLSLGRRMELLKTARRLRAVILEDDYDSDFRYDGEPLRQVFATVTRQGRQIEQGAPAFTEPEPAQRLWRRPLAGDAGIGPGLRQYAGGVDESSGANPGGMLAALRVHGARPRRRSNGRGNGNSAATHA